jgi:hypothetical protein
VRTASSPKSERSCRSAGLLRQRRRDSVTVFEVIAARKAEHSVKTMCRVPGVSRSGYHAWARRPRSARSLEDERLTGRVREIHRENQGVYGLPRVHAELVLADGERITRKRVERLMRQAASAASRKPSCAARSSTGTPPSATARPQISRAAPRLRRNWGRRFAAHHRREDDHHGASRDLINSVHRTGGTPPMSDSAGRWR